jgi:hypothetical protein
MAIQNSNNLLVLKISRKNVTKNEFQIEQMGPTTLLGVTCAPLNHYFIL